MDTRERRQLRHLRTPRHLRPLRRVPGLPAARPLQHHRPRAVRRRSSRSSFAGESVEFTVRMSESIDGPPALRACTRPKGEQIRDVDVSDLERRLTEASRSWRDDFTAAAIAEYGEDVRARRLARTLRRVVPRGLQGGLLRRDRRARPRPAGGARATSAPTSRSSRPLDAARGEARLKVFRRGAAALALRGAADPVVDGRRGRRRAALRARPRRPPVVHLRVRAALRPRPCPTSVRELFQDAIRAVWDGYNEIDGFNALVLAAGLTWRQATVLRAYAKYMRQGNSRSRSRLHRGGAARQHRHHPAPRAALRGPLRPGPQRPGRGRRGPHGEGRGDHDPHRARRSTTSPASTTTASCAPT